MATQDGAAVDGKLFTGDLISVAGDGVVRFRGAVMGAPPAEAGSPAGEFEIQRLVRWGNPVAVRGRTIVVLANGGQLATAADWAGGAAVRLDGDSIVVLTDLFGEVRLPRELVSGAVFAQQRHAADREELIQQVRTNAASQRAGSSSTPAESGQSDFVLLSNGDRVMGEVTELVRGSLTIATAAGEVKLPLSRVEAVGFGGRPLSVAGGSSKYAVGMQDGSLVYVEGVVANENKLKLRGITGTTKELDGGDVGDVVFLQLLRGPVTYLSDLDPAGYRHVPYLSMEWPYSRDRKMTGGPLVVDGNRYLKGIGMHSASRLTYRLDGKYSRFDAAVAIDDSADGRGSVTFGVYVMRDGKLTEAYKSDIVRGGNSPQAVSVDVAGAQALTLVVDYADRGDEMDRADWLDARVVR